MTEESMKLGQAKNQATQILKTIFIDQNAAGIKTIMVRPEFNEFYKDLVKKFYQLNEELDKEVLGKPETMPFKKVISPKKPSDKQKYCPKCNEIIPKTWKQHIVCGWKE